MDLVYKNEHKLFLISAIVSTMIWLLIVAGTFGLVLVYFALAYVFFLFVHSGFISYLKGTGIRISADQYPDLHARLLRCCEKTGVSKVPEAYLLRTGTFNALATRFLGRNFVVLFTDVVDALEEHQGALDFYIGHELGHIHRKHLLWGTFLMPASKLPLLGAAHRRAEEYTCDRYGVACCDSSEDIKAALAALAAGDSRWKSINVEAYLGQVEQTSGFWMSFNELTSDYPWLTKRMAAGLALSQGNEAKPPKRHLAAWILAAFVPRLGFGGAGSVLVVVFVVGVLAATAIPAYEDYTERTRMKAAYNSAVSIGNKVAAYEKKFGSWPKSLKDFGHHSAAMTDPKHGYEVALYHNGVIGAKLGETADNQIQFIVLEPAFVEGGIKWKCRSEYIDTRQLPAGCR